MTKLLRIGVIMISGKGWIGGSEYIKNIILALSSLPHEVRKTFEICLVFSKSSIDSDTYHQIEPHLNISYDLDSETNLDNFTNRVVWKIRRDIFKEVNPRMSDLCKKKGINFVYPHLASENEQTSNFQGCSWIADFQHKYLPNFFTKSEIQERNKYFEKISNVSQRIVLSSKTVATDFQKFFPNSKAKIEVLHFRTSIPKEWYQRDSVKAQKKYNLPDRFFLVSNQFWQHKNHGIIFEALRILKAQSISPIVVFTGNIYDYRNPDYVDLILQTIHKNDLTFQTYLLGLIPKEDQMQLMRRAIAVIQPSLFEGWSTVIEDARCLGKKMLLSDFEVHLEQNPPNSFFFERNSPQQLADLIDKHWRDMSETPNLDQEALARSQNIQEVQKFGYQFLAIANSKQ